MPKTSPPPADDAPVARLAGPDDVIHTVPRLIGFHPAASLVVLSLHSPRDRIHMTMRIDLPPVDQGADLSAELATDLAARVAHDRGVAAMVLVYSEQPDHPGDADADPGEPALPHRGLIAALGRALPDQGIAMRDAILVRGGRRWSYCCRRQDCCPPEGVAIAAPSGAASLVAAEHVAEGRQVMSSREELVAALAPVTMFAQVAMEQAFDRQAEALATVARSRGAGGVAEESIVLFRQALRRYRVPPVQLTDDEIARLVLALHDKHVRDLVVTWALEDGAALTGLLIDLTRRALPPLDAPVCTALGWVSYAAGNGAMASVAIDRALASRPDYTLAQLLRTGLDNQIHPREIRRLLTEVRGELSQSRRRGA